MKVCKKKCSWRNLAASLVMFFTCGTTSAQYLEDAIVKWTVAIPASVRSGDEFNIDVQFTIKPDWYIYAPDGVNASLGLVETNVIFNTSKISKVGRVKLPAAEFKHGHRVYAGDSIVIRQVFKTSSVQPGRYEIDGKVIYQPCNSEICLAPVIEKITVFINVN